jgi:DnaJ-domain-containing protein 1
MKNSPEYSREQLEIPERMRMQKRNEHHNSLEVSDKKED